MEKRYVMIVGPDQGSVDWKRMRDDIGEDRWRGYMRLRQAVRDSSRASAA